MVARRAAIFLFRFFAAGFSYGVDRDERPIARTRVFAPLTHPPPVSRARARSRGGIAFWSDVVARRAAIFLFQFFAAGFSYGVDRDERPIARTRVFAPLTHPPPVSRARARSRGGIAFWSDVVARRAAIFLFRFFAAGFSYGVDRDDSPIARTRVFPTASAHSQISVANGRR